MSTDIRGHKALLYHHYRRVQALCESRDGRPRLPVLNSPHGLCRREATLSLNLCHSELRSCVKVEVAVLGSPSLIVPMDSVDVKQRGTNDGHSTA